MNNLNVKNKNAWAFLMSIFNEIMSNALGMKVIDSNINRVRILRMGMEVI